MPSNVKNLELYSFIMDHYINTDKPFTLKQIALCNDTSVGNVKNFMYRHDINRLKQNEQKRKKIKKMVYSGMPVSKVAEHYKVSKQYIYYILNKK